MRKFKIASTFVSFPSSYCADCSIISQVIQSNFTENFQNTSLIGAKNCTLLTTKQSNFFFCHQNPLLLFFPKTVKEIWICIFFLLWIWSFSLRYASNVCVWFLKQNTPIAVPTPSGETDNVIFYLHDMRTIHSSLSIE